jgi:hypothetical protein
MWHDLAVRQRNPHINNMSKFMITNFLLEEGGEKGMLIMQ